MTPRLNCRIGIPLLGSHAVPLHRFGIVFRHTLAGVVDDAQVELRIGVALLRETPQFLKFLVSCGDIHLAVSEHAQDKARQD